MDIGADDPMRQMGAKDPSLVAGVRRISAGSVALRCLVLPRGDDGIRTHDQGFAGPDPGDLRDACSSFAGFRMRVC
jgi:hypothetical protein